MYYVDTYATLWTGIFIGMMIISMFYGLVHRAMKTHWYFIYAGVFLALAFLVRPFIYSLVVT